MAQAEAAARPQARVGSARLLQRACDCGAKLAGECESCRNKKRLQRKGAGSGRLVGSASLDSVGLTRGGAPLPAALGQRLAPLYRADFTGVRVHNDAASHAAARSVEARAFTIGQHVHFGAGQYRPQEREGLRLLAHELGHTLQQRGAESTGPAGDIEIDGAGSALEQEADAAADAALAGRPARIRFGGASGLQRRLLQRDGPRLPSTGIGSTAGGSDSATVVRKIDELTEVTIKRTVTEAPCSRERATKSTASDKIFEWDRTANAIKLNYVICNGRVQLGAKGEVSYDKVVESAKNVLTTLQKNPALGQDIGDLLNDRLDAATISATGEVSLVVDGILQAVVQGESTVGTAGQSIGVKGILKVTPRGISFAVTGGIDLSKTPLQQNTTYTLQARTATKSFAITLSYEQIDTSRVGGSSSSQGTIKGGLEIPLPDVGPLKGTTVAPSLSVDPGTGNVTPGISFQGHFGGPDKTPEVRCYRCECPPPQPEFSCTRVTKQTTRKVVDTPAASASVKLLFKYDSTDPADESAFANGVSSIAGMIGEGFKVDHVYGYASPEGRLDKPLQRGARFQGNAALSKARADYAEARISKAAPGASLPAAEAKGELLGSFAGDPDTPDRPTDELTPDLVELLKGQDDDGRLETLGVDASVRSDPGRRAQALADIDAFVSGKDEKGLVLAKRPRWEKIFPFLRRVQVGLSRAEVSHTEPVPGKTRTGCDDADIAYAKANMPELPPQRRIPPRECGT